MMYQSASSKTVVGSNCQIRTLSGVSGYSGTQCRRIQSLRCVSRWHLLG